MRKVYLEGHDGRYMFDELGDLEHHVRRVSILTEGSIDLASTEAGKSDFERCEVAEV